MRSLFAGRVIGELSLKTTAIVVAGSFGLGFFAGYGTALIPEAIRLGAEPSPSPSPSPTVAVADDVTVPSMQPILRDLDDQDALAGVVNLTPTYRGEATFTVVSQQGSPSAGSGLTRWVSISVENGIDVDPEKLREFVMDVLHDNRSWGSDNRIEFVETDGAADYRFVFASPYTAAAHCPAAHVAVQVGPVVEDSAAESATPEPVDVPSTQASPATPEEHACAQDGLVMVSMYDWTAAFSTFGAERTEARAYIVNHWLGHLFGNEESVCTSGRAGVMDDQRESLEGCTPNAWPYPDAETSSTPTVASSAS